MARKRCQLGHPLWRGEGPPEEGYCDDSCSAVGARVRHYGQQWAAAGSLGTGNIVEVKPGALGTFEFVVELDGAPDSDAFGHWNSEATVFLDRDAFGRPWRGIG